MINENVDLDLPSDELQRLVDQHTQEVQLWLDTRSPQAERFNGVGIRAGYTGVPVPLLNQVMGAHYPIDVPEKIIKKDFEDAIHFFEKRHVPNYWWLSPFSRPNDISQYFLDKGFETLRSLPAMVAFLPVENNVNISEEIHVWRASSTSDLRAASLIRSEAFDFPKGVGHDYFDAMPNDWLGSDAQLFLARVADGPPAAIAALICAAGIPGVYVMATLPEWRRRGLGKAVLRCILDEATVSGHRMIVLTASKFGYSLYKLFGFLQVFEYKIYSYALS